MSKENNGRSISIRMWIPSRKALIDRTSLLEWLSSFFPQMLEYVQLELEGSLLDPSKTFEKLGVIANGYLCVE